MKAIPTKVSVFYADEGEIRYFPSRNLARVYVRNMGVGDDNTEIRIEDMSEDEIFTNRIALYQYKVLRRNKRIYKRKRNS